MVNRPALKKAGRFIFMMVHPLSELNQGTNNPRW